MSPVTIPFKKEEEDAEEEKLQTDGKLEGRKSRRWWRISHVGMWSILIIITN